MDLVLFFLISYIACFCAILSWKFNYGKYNPFKPKKQKLFVTLNVFDKENNFLFTLKAKSIMGTLTNEQFVTGVWGQPLDRKGRAAKVDGNPSITSSDPSVLVVESPNPDTPDNFYSFKATPPDGATGSATVTITADADLGSGMSEITDFVSFDVKPEQAVGFAAPTVAEPQDKP